MVKIKNPLIIVKQEVSGGTGEDMLQARVDETKSCYNLMYYYYGTNPDIIKNLNTTGVTNMYQMFGNCKELTSLNVSNLNTSQVTDMAYMFLGCSKLETLDVSNFDTKNVTKMNNMFQECNALTSLDISNFDTSQIEGFNMQAMFNQCTNLQTVILPQNFVSNKITQINSMFRQCRSLKEIDLSVFDVSNVKYASSLFQNCNKLTSLDFSSWDTSNLKSLERIFASCLSLETIYGVLDFINVTGTVTDAFDYCQALKTVTLKNIKKTGLKLGSGTSWGTLLTLDTLINTIKELWDYSSGTTTYTLTMSTPSKTAIEDVYVKLVEPTAEQIEADPNIVNKMPCEVCESTDEGAMLITDYATLKKWTIAS